MSADLDKLPADEEWLRTSHIGQARATQNVLDALNLYRCRAQFAEQELARRNEPPPAKSPITGVPSRRAKS